MGEGELQRGQELLILYLHLRKLREMGNSLYPLIEGRRADQHKKTSDKSIPGSRFGF